MLVLGVQQSESVLDCLFRSFSSVESTGSIPGLGRLEKGMAVPSIILAWRIPWTEEPGRLQSLGSQELDAT